MKCLTITLDDKTLFSGEVHEITWQENDQIVSVTGKFTQGPGIAQQFLAGLQAAQQRQQPQVQSSPTESSDSVNQRPPLNVVQDTDE